MSNRHSRWAQILLLPLSLFLTAPVSLAQVADPDVQAAYYPEVIHAQGNVQVEQSPAEGKPKTWIKAEKGMKIQPGARIKTLGKSQVDLGLKNKYEMRIKEKSDIIAGSLAFNTKNRHQDTKYQLKQGSIYNRIQEGYLGKFEIEAPTVEVTAIGTEYGVDVWGPQQDSWVGSAQGELQAVNRLNNQPLTIPPKSRLEVGATEEESGKVVPMPAWELEGLQRELDKIGNGFDEDLDIRVYFILPYSTSRVRIFLNGSSLISNTNEPRKLQELFIPTVQMLPQRATLAQKILKNLSKIEFVCNYYADPRFTPHFLSFTAVIYHLLKSDEQAVKVFEQVLKDYPDFMYASIIQCAIGIIYEENLKDKAKAIEAYQKVLKNYPKSLEVEAAQDGLDRLGQ